MAVDINGERGDFFRSFKGLRQGDPLSPLLFNLVADALSSMLSAAASAGDIEGLVPHLVEGGLTHLQYADDTIIFLKNSNQNIANLKIILLCYEMMSGLKINYNKSEVFVMGVEEEEKERIATCFLCKVGQLPITYLGMPVSDCKLSKAQLSYLSDKVGQRLGTWKCGNLSFGGKSVLINSCLSSILMYIMAVYKLYEGNYQAIDSIRARFFWQGLGKKESITW